MSKGLAYLHNQPKQIIHRDLKSGNVLVALDEQDNFKVVKITDFDISKVMSEGVSALTIAGTPCFTAPEVFNPSKVGYTVQVDSKFAINLASDQGYFSLGIWNAASGNVSLKLPYHNVCCSPLIKLITITFQAENFGSNGQCHKRSVASTSRRLRFKHGIYSETNRNLLEIRSHRTTNILTTREKSGI